MEGNCILNFVLPTKIIVLTGNFNYFLYSTYFCFEDLEQNDNGDELLPRAILHTFLFFFF